MADATSLLETSLSRSIVETSAQLSTAAAHNHTAQINNFSRGAEVLSKRICEWDGSETVAHAEGYSRVSPVSQGHILGQTMSQVGGVLQNNQNYIAQGFAQLQTTLEGLRVQLAAMK